MENQEKYLLREKIANPFNPVKSPWKVAINAVFPDRVTVTNPNNVLAGRANIDDLLQSAEVPLLGNREECVRLPQEIMDRIVEIVEVIAPENQEIRSI